jgi:hypothetical protein
MLLQEFLSHLQTHPKWIAYALANGQPMQLLSASGKTLEANTSKKPTAKVQLEICVEPDNFSEVGFPTGPLLLRGEVQSVTSLKPGWKCHILVLDGDDVLIRRRAPRIHVHRMVLIGRVPGLSTRAFPVVVRDVGPEGLGIETRETFEKGDMLNLSGFEEFFENALGSWSFEVRSTFGKKGAGLLLLPEQIEVKQCLSELYSQLEILGRFWRALVGNARKLTGHETSNEVLVSVDFAVKQLKQRHGAQMTLINTPDLEKLHKALSDENELTRLNEELESLLAKKKALALERRKRIRFVEAFLKGIGH